MGRHGGRGLLIFTLALAQLMIVLDGTIVTIALPAIAADLDFSQEDLQWVVNAYALAFGGLLLLGGRIADIVGRRRTMVGSLIAFSAVSALGGLAQDQISLVLARGAQGLSAALLAPAALGTLSVSFHEPKLRGRAFAVFGAISTIGAVIGLLLGGIFTTYVSWRWTLWVNVPIGLTTAVLVYGCVPREANPRAGITRLRDLDMAGAVCVTAGLVALVFGLASGADRGWSSLQTVALMLGSGTLLCLFVLRQARVPNPLVPLGVVLERSRGGSYLASLFIGAGVLGMFYFLTQYLQIVRGYSAIATGIAFLPNTVAVLLGTYCAERLLPRIGPRPVAVSGSLLSALGVSGLALLGLSSSFAFHVLPASLVLAFGLGLSIVTLASTALHGVAHEDAGVASGLFTAAQQVGGACGLAIFAVVAATVTGTDLSAASITRGYGAGFAVAAVFFLIAAVLLAFTLRPDPEEATHEDEPILNIV